MISIGTGEIQKNTSIFTKINEAFEIVDKRKKKKLANGDLLVIVSDTVLMECFFVLTKFYKLPKNEVIEDLKTILFETLSLIESKNIDFVDALICAKAKLQGFGKLSFDKDVNRKC